MSRLPSHLAAFAAGCLFAGAIAAHAVPNQRSRTGADRYRTLDTFAQSLSYIANNYVEPVDERKLIYGAIRGMVRRLDRHSSFLPPNRYRRLRQDTEGEFGGVGIRLAAGPRERAHPVVDAVVARSPAARAGIRPGDRVIAIDGRATNRARVGDVRAWHSSLRGASGTRVELRVDRDGWSAPQTFALVRERVKIPTVSWLEIEPGLGYIKIDKFQEATAADVQAALRTLRARRMRGLILDLRGNPGGLLDQAVRVADLFLERGEIVSVRGRPGASVEHERAHAPGSFTGFRILALVDAGSASATEIVAAALQDHGRATIAGHATYGKGSIQTFLDLEDGSGLKLTTARFYAPSGRALEDTGITPDILFEPSPEDGAPPPDGTVKPLKPVTKAQLRRRLDADEQLRRAHQIVRSWSESK